MLYDDSKIRYFSDRYTQFIYLHSYIGVSEKITLNSIMKLSVVPRKTIWVDSDNRLAKRTIHRETGAQKYTLKKMGNNDYKWLIGRSFFILIRIG